MLVRILQMVCILQIKIFKKISYWNKKKARYNNFSGEENCDLTH